MYLDYSSTNNKTTNYAYQLKGFDDTWQYTTNTSITFNSLPYGHYQLQIKAQTNNGSWNKQIITIPIEVLKPFYKQIWFFISLFIGALLLFALWFWYRIRKAKNENLRLELLVDDRTHELKLSLQEQTALLQELHHRVKNNLQFITAMLKLQIKSTPNSEHHIVLENTSRRINAITLVHDMLYSKEKLERVSLKGYLNELVTKLNELVNTNSIKTKITLDVDELYFNINNCVAIGMMISELISNSIKYAFDNTGNPQIHISLKLNSNTNILQLSLKDNGIGIDTTKKSTGLGMRLIDIFARQMKATYTFKKQNGTLFTCQIPYKKL